MVVLGVEFRLLSRSFPVRRVSPVPIVSVEPGYRLCAVSSAELLGRIMLDCKVGGFGLTCAWHASVVWVLSCWWFALCVLPGIGGGSHGILMWKFLEVMSWGVCFGWGDVCMCVENELLRGSLSEYL